MKITFIGTGYVGLVSGVMMAHLGHNIVCLDIDAAKIKILQQGKVPIYEPQLEEYLKKYANTPNLQFAHDYTQSISDSEVIFITVGTPPKQNGEVDLSYIHEAIENSAKYAKENCIFVIKSTVPPGTCRELKNYLISKNLNFEIVSNPEFLREGAAIEDFMQPDRIVIGTDSQKALEIMQEVYKPLKNKEINLLYTDLTTAELIKYASNSFLANKIAFINEMADLCEVVDANIEDLSKGIGMDKRIGEDFLKAGPGFGGSCFPKDIIALQHLAKKINTECLILDAVIEANTNRPNKMIDKIINILGGNLKNKKFAVLGLTYKANTDDLRSSPAINLINLLKEKEAIVSAYDPKGIKNVPKYFTDLDCENSVYLAAKDADAIIIMTEWPEFKELDFTALKSILKSPIIIDLRNILDSNQMKALEFQYYSIGRKNG